MDKENLEEIKAYLKDKYIEIGIGLETVNDYIRNNYINKGISFKEFEELKCYIIQGHVYGRAEASIYEALQGWGLADKAFFVKSAKSSFFGNEVLVRNGEMFLPQKKKERNVTSNGSMDTSSQDMGFGVYEIFPFKD